MSNPRKRNSEILDRLKSDKNLLETKRTRTSLFLSAKIATGIKDKSWTKMEFAEKMGKKPSVITRWLSGTHNFTSDTLSDIEMILDIQLLSPYKEGIIPYWYTMPNPSVIHLTINVFTDSYAQEQSDGVFLCVDSPTSGVQLITSSSENLN